jgi:hypothetical protein
MFKEDNSGFINFPATSSHIVAVDSGKTLVYLVCFDPCEYGEDVSRMDNINLFSPGVFVSDDVTARPVHSASIKSLDSLVESTTEQNMYDSMYFPNFESIESWKRQMSINLISAVCIGWCNYTYEYRNDIRFWNATFKDLTYEGRNLYYSMKKLHNNKELRILTFSTN